jgi:hypothetical protein
MNSFSCLLNYHNTWFIALGVEKES